MEMKKILLVLMAALLSVGLTACGDEPKAEEKYSDDAYLKAMAKGLEDRWDYADSTTDDVSRKLYETAAQKELDQIKGFTDSKFKDSKLQEKAIQYINVTKESKKIAGEYGSDSFDSDWSKNADTRNQILADIDKEFNIPISKEYQTLLDEQNAKGKEVAEENDKTKNNSRIY
ncbi:hypothetical protein MCOL2_17702 [Listeria fleischmannii FSL S10-1203]|uniref:Lipoprotein n=2 Tax=Listeria fleischmannii TaxID=1069827 RepID=W7DRL8_9LIST|nr:hypothetical protein MCOL2_17702 [Listeria fleischmannii FSL S10-1203]